MIAPIEQFLKRHRLLFSALVGLLIAACVFAISFQGIIHSERKNLELSGDLFKRSLSTVFATDSSVFRFTKTLTGEPCAPAALQRLRKHIYLHNRLRDILVFDEDRHAVVCTALAGALEKPYLISEPARPHPKFPNRFIWNEPRLGFLPGDGLHHVTRDGRYGLVLGTDRLKESYAGQDWQVYVRTKDDRFGHHSFGNMGLYEDYAASNSSFLFPNKIVARVCYEETHFLCLLIGRPVTEVIGQNIPIIVPSLVLALLLGALGFAGSERAIASHGSPEGRIRKAMKKPANTNFHCHYQPVIDLETGRIAGCEVLARYNDQLGPIPPYTFIPIIEATGQTWKFTEMIMRRVVEDFDTLGDIPTDFRVAINVFPADLDSSNLGQVRDSEVLRDLLGVGTRTVCEILETGVTDRSNSAETLKFLSDAGVEIAIDDFGTGFSNLEQLKAVDTDYLKIDKSFVDELSATDGSVVGAFVKHIVSLASEMSIKVVAEGIEEKEQISMLQDLGVQYGQGYYFSRPVSLAEFGALLNRDFYGPGANDAQISAAG
jgi:sensor c-di-GMP phosphodiesterase-like protein